MTITPARSPHIGTGGALLARLIDAPDLARSIRALSPPAFSQLVRHVGVEDAGEVVALATHEQLVAAFDEDLFTNARPGDRETFDAERFAVWLDALLDAGEAAAAARVAELSEDFTAHALSSMIMVLDHDALRDRLDEGGRSARRVDKAIESCLSEEIDGYLLISRRHDGWDAALALILALDRDHRSFLTRVLDRCAAAASGYLDDLDELSEVLSSEASLAEDAEAEREERRAKRGYVEPRAAKSFLALAKQPLSGDLASAARDPITRAFFRDLDTSLRDAPAKPTSASATSAAIHRALGAVSGAEGLRLPSGAGQAPALIEAMKRLRARDPKAFEARMEELAYLVNVLVAAASGREGRMSPGEALEAVIDVVSRGVALEARRGAPDEVLSACPADLLFRRAMSASGASI